MAVRKGVVVHDTDVWWTVLIVDPLAVPLVRLVIGRTWVTPMRLTAVAHLIGVVSAVLFALGELVPAALLYEARFIIDCMDGKLARTRGTSSKAGAFVDFVGDYVIAAANMAGVAVYLLDQSGTHSALAVGLPVVFVTHLAVRMSTEQVGTMRQVASGAPGPYRRWMAERRLEPAPSRVDVEHGLLFVAPLVSVIADADWPLVAAAWAATAYFAYVLARYALAGYSMTRSSDRSTD